MKARELIEILRTLDPEKDIHVCACMFCAGGPSTEIHVRERRNTEWDHRTKQAETKSIIVLEAD